MQTERVTFLTSPDQKAALDAFAATSGMSVGHVVREATSRYIAAPANDEGEAAVLDAALAELERSLPSWEARLESIERAIDDARVAIKQSLAAVDATK